MAVYCAIVADVVIDTRTGRIRVEHAYAAVDAGLVINPNGIKNQIDGGMVQATSWSLIEQMDYSNERINTQQWSDYPILRFTDVPRIEVEVINRPSEKSLGVGEGAQGPMVAAIANAVFAASGVRLRETPLKLAPKLRT
jgi:CO/xanthine dehydrogenase Mo-binding subunit